MRRAIAFQDFSVIYGSRGKADQDRAFEKNYSKVEWPDSYHNCPIPGDGPRRDWDEDPDGVSDAIDVAPYPVDWGTRGTKAQREAAERRFVLLAGRVLQIAQEMYEAGEIASPLIWGGDWDADNDLRDQTFNDLAHFQRKLARKR